MQKKEKREATSDKEKKEFRVSYFMLHVFSSGFTLVELLVIISLVIAISVVVLPNLLGNRNVRDLTNTASQIAALLRQAQNDSMVQTGGMSWGVHFQNATTTAPFYALFSSTSSAYSASGTTGYYRLPNTVVYLTSTIPAGTSVDIVFSQISGLSSVSTSIGLYLLNQPSSMKIISIASSGAVSL
jgi:type II secretory pathway pseudopilin PulG